MNIFIDIYQFYLSFYKYIKSKLFGLSIGKPKARDHTPFDIQPRALETAKTTV